MGVHPEIRKFLKERYQKAWTFSKIFKNYKSDSSTTTIPQKYIKVLNGEYQNYQISTEWQFYPKDVQVALYDAMGKFKSHPKNMKNGLQYLNYIVQEMFTFYQMPFSEAFFFVLDRGSPVNKSQEQTKRYGKLSPLEYDEKTVFINDQTIFSSSKDENAWKTFSSNKILNQELRYYITRKLIYLDEMRKNDNVSKSPHEIYYTPPVDKILFLFGGQKNLPVYPRSQRTVNPIDHQLYFVENRRDLSTPTQPYVRKSGIYQGADNECNQIYNENEQSQLLEGESAVLYFAKPYTSVGKTVLIISSDGDLIFQLLLQCKDRLNIEGKFKNQVYLRLVSTGKKKSQEEYEDIDINLLYQMMIDDPIFKENGVSNPELFYSMASVLLKNDFFKGFVKGVGNVKLEKDNKIPILLKTMFDHLDDLKGIIQYIIPDSDDNLRHQFYEKIPILINESLFLKFTHLIYIAKWWTIVEKFEKDNGSLSSIISTKRNTENDELTRKIEKIERYISQRADFAKKKIMGVGEIRTFARMTEWVLNYNLNNYRRDCAIVSPLSLYEGMPYYGWTDCHITHTCIQGTHVCKQKKPLALYDWFSISKKTLLNLFLADFDMNPLMIVEEKDEKINHSIPDDDKIKTYIIGGMSNEEFDKMMDIEIIEEEEEDEIEIEIEKEKAHPKSHSNSLLNEIATSMTKTIFYKESTLTTTETLPTLEIDTLTSTFQTSETFNHEIKRNHLF